MINNYYSLEEGFQIDVTAILMLKCMESTLHFLVFIEARAAFEAGFTTAISVRPGNEELTKTEKGSFRTIATFNELYKPMTEDSPAKKTAKTDEKDFI